MTEITCKTSEANCPVRGFWGTLLDFVRIHKDIFLLSLLWLVMVFLVNPIGEFPLQDDWLYSHSVMQFLQKGFIELYDTQTTLAIGNILWGTLFAKFFGFSMSILRIATLVLGLFGVAGTYRLLKSTEAGSFLSFAGALTMATTPLYFGMANSFMTDVPFCAFSILAYAFFLLFLRRDTLRFLVLGIIFSCLAILTRQIAAVVPFSFSLAYLVYRGINRKSLMTAVLICCASCAPLTMLPLIVKNVPQVYASKWGIFAILTESYNTPVFGTVLFAISWRAAVVLMYVGFFLSPFLLLLLPSQWRSLRLSEKIFSLGLCGALTGYLLVACRLLQRSRCLMPFGINCIRDFAFGPVTLIGNELPTPAPVPLWIIVTILGIIGSSILLANFLIPLFRFLRNPKAPLARWNVAVWVLCASGCFAYFFPWALNGQFDRYFIFYIPLALLLVLTNRGTIYFKGLQRFLFPVFLVMILLIGFYSVAGTHDYLEWNRVRWQVLNALMRERRLTPREIDGGYEYNGWYNYFSFPDAVRYAADESLRKSTNKSFWWLYDDKYVLAFVTFSGYELLQSFPCKRWLPPRKAPPLLLLRRMEKQ